MCPRSLGVRTLSGIYAGGGGDGEVELCVSHLGVSPGEEQTLSADGGEQAESDGPGSNPCLNVNKRSRKLGETVNLGGLDRGLGYAPLRRTSARDEVVPAAGGEMSSGTRSAGRARVDSCGHWGLIGRGMDR